MTEVLEILKQGLSLMCIGMGTVLIFLCILIISMNVMSFFVAKLNKIFPEVVPAPAGGAKKVTTANDDSEVAVAIVAAMFSKK